MTLKRCGLSRVRHPSATHIRRVLSGPFPASSAPTRIGRASIHVLSYAKDAKSHRARASRVKRDSPCVGTGLGRVCSSCNPKLELQRTPTCEYSSNTGNTLTDIGQPCPATVRLKKCARWRLRAFSPSRHVSGGVRQLPSKHLDKQNFRPANYVSRKLNAALHHETAVE